MIKIEIIYSIFKFKIVMFWLSYEIKYLTLEFLNFKES
jgi:hypothetical protein